MSALITVLLPVYNGAADVERAIRSILSQTYTDFELLVINDGSQDASAEILDRVKDRRLHVIHQENRGLAATLNRGLAIAAGKYIARQDQDDLSHPDRLAKQLAYMEANPDCILLGTAADIWVEDTPTKRIHEHAQDHATLSFDLIFNNPFVHSSVMLRKDIVLEIGGYCIDSQRQPPEDYELWSRLSRHGRVGNLQEHLVIYREVPQSMSRTGPSPFLDNLVTICAENLAWANGMKAPDTTCIDVAAFTHSAFHRISAHPNLRKMQRLILRAGENIAATSGNHEIKQRAQVRAGILKYQFFLRRTNLPWLEPVAKRIRALLHGLRLR